MSILLAVASVGAAGSSAAGQDTVRTTGNILGSIFDSTTSAPLANARVTVFGTSLVAESNEQGRFRLDGVPVGEHSVVYFHQRLATLGLGTTPVQVLVDGESVSRVTLTVPSRSTLLSAWCSAEPEGGPISAGGIVTDALTGVPLPRATVRALGSRTGILQRRRVVRKVRTEASGEFRLCNLDASEPLMVTVAFGNSDGTPVQIAAPGSHILDFAIDIWDPVTITGSVLDYATRAPIRGAHVQLVGSDHSQLTDADGVFGFTDVPPGKQIIETSLLGYAPRVDSLTVFSNEALGLEIELATEAIALEPLVVVGRRREPVFTTPGTRFSGVTEAQVDSIAHRVVDFAGIAREARMPGLSIKQVMSGDEEILCIEMSRSWRSGDPASCNMVHVLVNDAPIANPQVFLQHMNPRDVRRIQFITPIEAGVLYGTRGAAGVLLIYLR
ncbi:MAG: carboxypeptidase regulatory-like domain-containing protein [Gemmatimonadetes bacterium]|nr:carboxypeptidase regulatory-like domain-containing protein [Gemmatimonadota bacterium]